MMIIISWSAYFCKEVKERCCKANLEQCFTRIDNIYIYMFIIKKGDIFEIMMIICMRKWMNERGLILMERINWISQMHPGLIIISSIQLRVQFNKWFTFTLHCKKFININTNISIDINITITSFLILTYHFQKGGNEIIL